MAHGKVHELRDISSIYEAKAKVRFIRSADLPETGHPGYRGPVMTPKNKPKYAPRAERRHLFKTKASRDERLAVRRQPPRWIAGEDR